MTSIRDMTPIEILWRVARVLLIVWLFVFAVVYTAQSRLLYVPLGGELDPTSLGVTGLTATKLNRPDGVSLVAWRAMAAPGKPTILYFHGNGGHLSHRQPTFAKFVAEGWGIYAISYRGFSGSTGAPAERDNIADALGAYDELARTTAASDIVIYGESLGTGVAIKVAATRPARAVVLEASYSSIADIAADRFWFLPVQWVIKDRYDAISDVRAVKAPILMLHGVDDPIIPVRHARRLAAAIAYPFRAIEYPTDQHIGLLNHGGLEEMRNWISQAGPVSPPPAGGN